jgi:hypothetical protein
MTQQDMNAIARLICELEHKADLSGIKLHVYAANGRERSYRSQARNAIYAAALRAMIDSFESGLGEIDTRLKRLEASMKRGRK